MNRNHCIYYGIRFHTFFFYSSSSLLLFLTYLLMIWIYLVFAVCIINKYFFFIIRSGLSFISQFMFYLCCSLDCTICSIHVYWILFYNSLNTTADHNVIFFSLLLLNSRLSCCSVWFTCSKEQKITNTQWTIVSSSLFAVLIFIFSIKQCSVITIENAHHIVLTYTDTQHWIVKWNK